MITTALKTLLTNSILFIDPYEQRLAGKISLQGFIYNIFAQTGTLSVFGNEDRFLRFWVIFWKSYLRNEFGNPHFLTFLT